MRNQVENKNYNDQISLQQRISTTWRILQKYLALKDYMVHLI